jgi:protein-S-isoprenylcysteine O-methyltransferase Ste14
MPHEVRLTLIVLGLIFLVAGGYYRIQSQRTGERLDRTKEGWPILIGIRLSGLIAVVSTVGCLANAHWLARMSWPAPMAVRWLGVAGFACAVVWLLWMFRSLGHNLTDTVVTRQDAYLVVHGPYRFVRNPMYTGVLVMGLSLGLAMGNWLVPLATSLVFTLMAIRTRTEEKFLIERFGDRYREYMARVGRFFPSRGS